MITEPSPASALDATPPPSRMAWWSALQRLPRATTQEFRRHRIPALLALVCGLVVAFAISRVEHPWHEQVAVVAREGWWHALASWASWSGKFENGLAEILLAWLAVAIVFRLRRHQASVMTLLWAQLVAGVLVNLGKSGLGRSRPNTPGPDTFIGPTLDYAYQSFPSGHTTAAFALAVTLAGLYPRWTAPALLYAALVGWSRVALHVHHPSDVLMGAVLGSVVGLVCSGAGRRLGAGQARLNRL